MKSRACIRHSQEQRKPLLSWNQWLNRGGIMGTTSADRHRSPEPPSRRRGGGAIIAAAVGRGPCPPATKAAWGGAICAAAVECRLSMPRRSREQRKPLLSLNQWLNRGGIMGTNLRLPPSQPRAATKAAWGRCDQARQQPGKGSAFSPPGACRRRGGRRRLPEHP